MFRNLGSCIVRLSEKTCFSVPLPMLFCFLYFIIQGISFAQFKSGADVDTAEMLLYTQYWDWGYGGSQPPFYSWLTFLLVKTFGLSLLTLSLVKFAMLCIAFMAIYGIARTIGLSPLASASAMFGIFAIPVIGWEAQRSLSHSSALLAFSSLGVLAFIHAAQTGAVLSYLAFSLTLAGAVLSKYNAFIVFAALMIASLYLQPWRRSILSEKFAMAVLTAAMLTAPHFLWALNHQSATLARASKFNFHAGGSVLMDFLLAMKSFISSNVLMMSILVIVAIVAAIRLKITTQEIRLPQRNDPASLFIYVIVISLTMIAIGLVMSGATALPNRWLQPIMLFFPLALAILFTHPHGNSNPFRSESADKCNSVQCLLATVGLFCALMMTLALPLTAVYKKSDIPKANQLNYAKLHAEISNALGRHPSAILLTDYAIFANLRLYQPDLAIFHPYIDASDRLNRDPLVVLWEGHGPMPLTTRNMANRVKSKTDGWLVVKTHLGRVDNPKISLAVSYAYDPNQVRLVKKTALKNT